MTVASRVKTITPPIPAMRMLSRLRSRLDQDPVHNDLGKDRDDHLSRLTMSARPAAWRSRARCGLKKGAARRSQVWCLCSSRTRCVIEQCRVAAPFCLEVRSSEPAPATDGSETLDVGLIHIVQHHPVITVPMHDGGSGIWARLVTEAFTARAASPSSVADWQIARRLVPSRLVWLS